MLLRPPLTILSFFVQIMRQIGGLGGGPGGDMDKPSFEDLDAEEDSDDEGMPDLETMPPSKE
jgi:hypothetical protein